jgi:SecD/SecF fusion protein
MVKLARWKVVLVALAAVFGILFTLPNLLPAPVRDSLPGFAPKQTLNLGLDLQGGSYLLLEVDTNALRNERLTNMVEDVRTTLTNEHIDFSGLGQAGGVVSVRVNDPGQLSAAANALRRTVGAPLAGSPGGRDVDVSTTADQRINMSFVPAAFDATAAQAVEQSIEIIRRRIDQLGTKSPDITRQGKNRIVIEAPGESDPEKLKRIIGQTAKLTFQMVDDQASPADIAAGRLPPGDEMLPYAEAGREGQAPLVVKKRFVVSGEMLTYAAPGFDQQTGQSIVQFRFNGVGAKKFGDVTRMNVGKRFAIVLDKKIISAPTIINPILGGSGQITGSFTPESANELAILLKAGALPAPLNVEEQKAVGAELGADAVRSGEISTAVGFVAILVFMLLSYGGLFGGIAIGGLILNGLLIIGTMSVTQATLTLPGIAGLILTLAVAVDANVLIYERIRDEIRAGRSVIAAMDSGFNRALTTIFDANMTTMIAALIMFQFGAGPVKGFAWTLSIGVLTSVFSAVVITQVLLGWWFKIAKPKILPIADDARPRGWPIIKILPHQTKFRFVRLARIMGVLSVVGVAASLFMTIYPAKPPCGGLTCGIDFQGGTVLEISTAPVPVDLAKARAAVNAMNIGDVQVQGFGAPSSAMVQFQTPAGANPNAVVTRVEAQLTQALGQVKFTRADVVGPKVSGELFRSGIMALGVAIGLMLLYIWFRFELQFGLGAVMALFHDVILSFGVIAVSHLEFNLNTIAAILTIIGYSMNDTVVVFDRLRENLRKYKRMPLREVIDISINETLSRTIITGLTAELALGGLAFFGGPTLYGMSLVLMFGIAIGTYSSIYVASPVILLWGVKRGEEEAEPLKPPPRAGQVRY